MGRGGEGEGPSRLKFAVTTRGVVVNNGHCYRLGASRFFPFTHTKGSASDERQYLPGVPVAVHLGSNGIHDVLLPLDALLPPLNLLDVLLALVLPQLLVPLPEHFAVRSDLQAGQHPRWLCTDPLRQT